MAKLVRLTWREDDGSEATDMVYLLNPDDEIELPFGLGLLEGFKESLFKQGMMTFQGMEGIFLLPPDRVVGYTLYEE